MRQSIKLLVLISGIITGYFLLLFASLIIVENGLLWRLTQNNFSKLDKYSYTNQLLEISKEKVIPQSLCVGDMNFVIEYCNTHSEVKKIVLPSNNRSVVSRVLTDAEVLGINGRIYFQTPVWFWTNIADTEYAPAYDYSFIDSIISPKNKMSINNVRFLIKSIKQYFGVVLQKNKNKSYEVSSLMNANFEMPMVKNLYHWNLIERKVKNRSSSVYWVNKAEIELSGASKIFEDKYKDYLKRNKFPLGKILVY